MAGQLADLLTMRRDHAIQLWVAGADGPAATDAPGLLDAVVSTLAGGSEDALLLRGFLDPDTPDTDAAAHLDVVLRQLNALMHAVERIAAEAHPDDGAAMRAEMAELQRRVAVRTVFLFGERSAELRARMEEKSAALGVTVHELRRPLTILTSYAELLSDGTLGDLPEAAMTGIQGMSGATEVMSHLIEALAEVARLEDADDIPAEERFTLGDLVHDAVGEVITESRLRGISIEASGDPGLLMHGDRRRLCLAITNLLSNAIKHSPANGLITVRAVRDNEMLRLAVIDRGPGFPPQEAERLFEKYYRSAVERDSGIPGTGLGLFIVRSVAERHGGTVAARVRGEGGAEFELSLPLN
jgi:signal transduction histidine kinase